MIDLDIIICDNNDISRRIALIVRNLKVLVLKKEEEESTEQKREV